ncbi:MAG: SDR family oxidoreductase [Candidatus Bathyarchaeia archaeon]
MESRVFITGSTGKLGKELVKVFPGALAPTHEMLDVTDKEAILSFIRKNKPDLVIHCAALTGIRECEKDKELAWRVNVEGTENLVRACEKVVRNCYFAYISTACVFYGDRGNYVETDIPYPKNFYSLTKLLGEFAVKYSKLKKWLIIRTNFVAREKWPYPKAFVDRYGTYLFADDLALAIRSVMERNITGIVHICGEKKISMFELARITTPDVKPMSLSEYNGPPLTVDMSLGSIRIKPFKLTEHR